MAGAGAGSLAPEHGSLVKSQPAPPTGGSEYPNTFPTLQESAKLVQHPAPAVVVKAGEADVPFVSSATRTGLTDGQHDAKALKPSNAEKQERAREQLIDYDAEEVSKAHGNDKSLQQKVKEALEENVQALEESSKQTAEKSRALLQGSQLSVFLKS